MPGSAADLYEQDFVRWTEQQSSALRQAAGLGTNLPLDWENLAEEIESSGASQRRELRSRIGGILEHLLKLEHSSAKDLQRRWIESTANHRSEIELFLNDSPSLRADVARIIAEEAPKVARRAIRMLRLHGEEVGSLQAPNYTEEQVLGDWFPGEAVHLAASGERDEPE